MLAASGCGRAKDAPPAEDWPPPVEVAPRPSPEGDAGDAVSGNRDSGARSSDAASLEGCPALSTTQASDEMRWARDPGTGNCCPYEQTELSPVPPNQLIFATRAECDASCGCRQLECICNGIECPSTLEAAAESLCANAHPDYAPAYWVIRREGCGRALVVSGNGYASRGWVFAANAASGAGSPASATLVGATSGADVDTEPCASFSWSAGEDFDCDEYVACQVCGEPFPLEELPACD